MVILRNSTSSTICVICFTLNGPSMHGESAFPHLSYLFPSRALKFPQCLYMLEAVQHADFRDALAVSTNAKYIEDQLLLQWHFYLRKKTRLFVSRDSCHPLNFPHLSSSTPKPSSTANASRNRRLNRHTQAMTSKRINRAAVSA